MTNEIKIDMSDVCELADELTKIECDRLGIVYDNDIEQYTDDVQAIFDKYYDIITNSFKI